MNQEDIRNRLSTLTERQREVLTLRCDGLEYKSIAKELYIGVPTVKTHMGNIYIKLGLEHLTSAKRQAALFEVVCPILRETELPPAPPDESEEPEPVPAPVIDMVEEDEKAIVPWIPGEIITVESEQINNHNQPNRLRWFLAGIIFSIIIMVGVYVLLVRFAGWSVPEFGSQPTQAIAQVAEGSEIQIQEVTREVTVAVTSQAESTNPAPILADETGGVTVTETPQSAPPTTIPSPTPSIVLPFYDDFDSGPSPSWKALNGTWITVDGRYTIMPEKDFNWVWTWLNEPTWTNYILSVDTDIPHYGSANQDAIAFAVRVRDTQPEFFGFYVDRLSRGGWSLIGLHPHDTTLIAGRGSFNVPATGEFELEVAGNQFIARIDGREIQRITYQGDDSGGVALGISCNVSTGCPSYDNLRIESINP